MLLAIALATIVILLSVNIFTFWVILGVLSEVRAAFSLIQLDDTEIDLHLSPRDSWDEAL